jgi:hypothetical protein
VLLRRLTRRKTLFSVSLVARDIPGRYRGISD